MDKTFVSETADVINMRLLIGNGQKFAYHSFGLYGTNVVFQKATRPSEIMIEGKPYYSRKLKPSSFRWRLWPFLRVYVLVC